MCCSALTSSSEFAFDGHIVLVGVFHDLLGQGDVVVGRLGGAVDHDGGETELDAALAEFEGIAVVEVEGDRDHLAAADFTGVFDSALREVAEQGLVGVVARALGDLQNHRGLLLGAGLDDGLKLLHVVEIERRDRIASLHRLGKHLSGVDKTQIFE